MSPAERASKSGCFAIRRGQASHRSDPNYHIKNWEAGQRLAAPLFPLASVANVEQLIQYGCSKRADYEESGVRILRMNNLQEGGWDFTDVKRVQLTPGELSLWRLERGDLVFNRTNSKELVGKCEVFDLEGEWIFASYLMRLRINVHEVLPVFLRDFLSGPAGRVQIDRDSRQIAGMSNINAEEIRRLLFPKPDPDTQARLVRQMDAARESRRKQLQEADELISGIAGFLLDQLGLTLPPVDDRNVWAARLGDRVRERSDANFHYPRYRKIEDWLEKIGSVRLGALCRISEERTDPLDGEGATFRYIEISTVNSKTGEARAVDTPRNEAPSRARMVVHNGNIIVSLTRAHRGSIAMIDESLEGCVASTGFAVLSDIDTDKVEIGYLWAFLRSQPSLLQMLQRSSGGNYPAITEDELCKILIPIPSAKVQDRIVAEVEKRREKTRRLREEAALLWDNAKRRFEEELLGPPPGRGSVAAGKRKGGR